MNEKEDVKKKTMMETNVKVEDGWLMLSVQIFLSRNVVRCKFWHTGLLTILVLLSDKTIYFIVTPLYSLQLRYAAFYVEPPHCNLERLLN